MRTESLFNTRNALAPFRLLSIRARTSGGATDFLLASALFDHHPTLRSTGEEDARCVEPTSATHTNYVHPHVVCSQLASLVTQRGRPTETKAPYDTIGGPDVSRHPRPLRLDYDLRADLELYSLAGWRHERGRFLPTTLRRSSL